MKDPESQCAYLGLGFMGFFFSKNDNNLKTGGTGETSLRRRRQEPEAGDERRLQLRPPGLRQPPFILPDGSRRKLGREKRSSFPKKQEKLDSGTYRRYV